MGREAHREYLQALCSLILREEIGAPALVAAAENCRALCDQPGVDPSGVDTSKLHRQLNRVRHALLRHLGAEPAEWDLLAPASVELDSAARRILPIRVYLEEIRSPYNVGAIFRSAEAFGVRELLLSPTTASPLHPRAVKSARGAIRIMPWRFAELADLPELIESEHLEGIFALELGGTPLDRFSFPERGVMLVGSEELGLSPKSLNLAASKAGRISIPMAGAKRSLNVAVAVGIVLQAWHASVTGRRSEPNAKEGTKRTSAPRIAKGEPPAP
ncbi:MAG: TrmH family RNA methyltransferase [Spirochaetaceae bacterium]|nr:MAG: TrmH family RNA methyltransferase [Spirochaetaceae bacterium]